MAKQSISVPFFSIRSKHSTISVHPLNNKTSSRVLRKRGIRLFLYLDDMLIIGSTPQARRTVNLLESLGFIINKEKSVLTPNRIIAFLGFTINSITYQQCSSLCLRKGAETTNTMSSDSLRLEGSSSNLSQLLGLLESYRKAVRGLESTSSFPSLTSPPILLIRGLNQSNHNYETRDPLCFQSKQEINWWLQNSNLEKVNGSPIIPPTPDLTIFTDASSKGWGRGYLRQH
jgi:hypothetical protein